MKEKRLLNGGHRVSDAVVGISRKGQFDIGSIPQLMFEIQSLVQFQIRWMWIYVVVYSFMNRRSSCMKSSTNPVFLFVVFFPGFDLSSRATLGFWQL